MEGLLVPRSCRGSAESCSQAQRSYCQRGWLHAHRIFCKLKLLPVCSVFCSVFSLERSGCAAVAMSGHIYAVGGCGSTPKMHCQQSWQLNLRREVPRLLQKHCRCKPLHDSGVDGEDLRSVERPSCSSNANSISSRRFQSAALLFGKEKPWLPNSIPRSCCTNGPEPTRRRSCLCFGWVHPLTWTDL